MLRVFPIKNDDDDDENHNTNKEGKRKLWEVMAMFTVLMVLLASWVHIYPQSHGVVHIEHVTLFTRQLYFNKLFILERERVGAEHEGARGRERISGRLHAQRRA